MCIYPCGMVTERWPLTSAQSPKNWFFNTCRVVANNVLKYFFLWDILRYYVNRSDWGPSGASPPRVNWTYEEKGPPTRANMNFSSLQQTTPTSPFHLPSNFCRSKRYADPIIVLTRYWWHFLVSLRLEPCTAPFISVLNEFASTAFSRLHPNCLFLPWTMAPRTESKAASDKPAKKTSMSPSPSNT